MIEINSVERMATAAQWLLGWEIDEPRRGAPIDGYFLRIAGWVAGREAPAHTIEVVHDEFVITRVAVMLVRPDVSRAMALRDESERTGFDVAVNIAGLPEQFEFVVRVYCVDIPPADFAIIRGTHSPLRTSFRPHFHPLSITSLGRTGTTLLMQMLDGHPEVLVHRVFPYETRIAAYWMHALTILAAPALHSESSHPDTFLDERFFIGHNPFAPEDPAYGAAFLRWLRGGAVEDVAAFCQHSIEESYLRIAQDQSQEGMRFFAEKNVPTHVPRLLWQMYDGMREIVLVRDLRDMICSMTAFDARRKTFNFRGSDFDIETFIVRMASDYTRLVAEWQARREKALLLRYEDLVAEPRTWLQRVADYVGIDSSAATVERMMTHGTEVSTDTLAHRTTENWSRSVGRYRRDMDEEVRGFCDEIGGSALTTLGYAD